MMKNQFITVGVALIVILSCATAPALAQHDRRGEAWREGHAPPRGYVLDNRYHHNRYYPRHGYAVPVLPRGYRAVPYRGARYYFQGGVWYRHSGTQFVVVVPPVGLIAPVLPPFYTTIWVGGLPYYYAAGVYYTWLPEAHGYVVTEAPPASVVSEEPATSGELYIYPEKGQSKQQQTTDRYECHHWAVGQTGFDPTQPGGNVPESQNATKRADYRRAMMSCLQGRGYSVQ